MARALSAGCNQELSPSPSGRWRPLPSSEPSYPQSHSIEVRSATGAPSPSTPGRARLRVRHVVSDLESQQRRDATVVGEQLRVFDERNLGAGLFSLGDQLI